MNKQTIDSSLTRNVNESFDDFFVRIWSNRNALGLSCEECADIMNRESGKSLGESAWRKKWKSWSAGMRYATEHLADDYLISQVREIEKQRIRLQDERAALKRIIRKEAREDALKDILRESLSNTYDVEKFIFEPTPDDNDKTLVVCLSDLHIGMYTNNTVGTNGSDVSYNRMTQYLSRVVDTIKKENVKYVIIALLGDLISGNIHSLIRVENKENIIEQIKTASLYIGEFVECILSTNVHVDLFNVSGNHSRVTSFEDCQLNERLDELIPFYLKTRFESSPTAIKFHDGSPEVGYADTYIGDSHVVFVHGDLDNLNEQGIAKLQSITGKIDALFSAHLHHVKFDDVFGVHVIQSGTLLSSSDQYCIKNRLHGEPTQALVLFDKHGTIESFIPVYLR